MLLYSRFFSLFSFPFSPLTAKAVPLSPGGVRPMIAKHAGRYRKTAHSYQHRRRVRIK